MKLYSTRNSSTTYSLHEAVLQGLAPDQGLFMPDNLSPMHPSFFREISGLDNEEIAFCVAHHLLKQDIPVNVLQEICSKTVNFPVPVVPLTDQLSILELFHGPSAAFKDFGAQFLAQLMSHIYSESKKLIVLVATSGDTGGAVAYGFSGIEGIDVVILYPAGKVSRLQEKQLTTQEGNVKAIRIEGTFDDCQKLVKTAFLDDELTSSINLTSANSINIGRLLPQMFYYFIGYKYLAEKGDLMYVVPSGNLGNLTAGLFAKKLGLPVKQFVAASNKNKVFPEYLKSSLYQPHSSYQTISNAMDVGDPSNFERILSLYGSTWNAVKEDMSGYNVDDGATLQTIKSFYKRYNYVLDPHTAVGVTAALVYQEKFPGAHFCVLSTAHPAKFLNVLPEKVRSCIKIPPSLTLNDRKSHYVPMRNDYKELKQFLLQAYGGG